VDDDEIDDDLTQDISGKAPPSHQNTGQQHRTIPPPPPHQVSKEYAEDADEEDVEDEYLDRHQQQVPIKIEKGFEQVSHQREGDSIQDSLAPSESESQSQSRGRETRRSNRKRLLERSDSRPGSQGNGGAGDGGQGNDVKRRKVSVVKRGIAVL
jgi:type IV secretory pathway VirB10-like protein